mmetsp:Transcript_26006/g.64983  ORF Transcript_26006/g.64983 Transcript_26006/m.64983 type:complete len:94 (+) Transcript_26006:295-576(+)
MVSEVCWEFVAEEPGWAVEALERFDWHGWWKTTKFIGKGSLWKTNGVTDGENEHMGESPREAHLIALLNDCICLCIRRHCPPQNGLKSTVMFT